MNQIQFVMTIILSLSLQYSFCISDIVEFNHRHPPQYQHHHHHHGYDMNFNNNNNDNKSSIDNTTTIIQKIPPLEFFEKMNEYDNIELLIANLVEDNGEHEKPDLIESRFGDPDERSALVRTDPAICQPERKTIRLIESNDPTIIHIPECTRIERCGGCCNNDLYECQPIQTESVTMKVLKTRYTGSQKLAPLEKLLIPIERHLKCRCDCRIKAKDCNQFQKYDKRQCSCICINTDEREKCYQNSDLQIWNNEICACQCRKAIQCTTGSYFDPIKCKCLMNIKTRFSSRSSNVEIPEEADDGPIPYDL